MAHLRAVVVSEIVEHAAVGQGNIREFLHYGYIDTDNNNFYYDGNWEARDNANYNHYPNSDQPEDHVLRIGEYQEI